MEYLKIYNKEKDPNILRKLLIERFKITLKRKPICYGIL